MHNGRYFHQEEIKEEYFQRRYKEQICFLICISVFEMQEEKIKETCCSICNDYTNLRFDFRCIQCNDAQNGRYIKVQSTSESLNETKLFFWRLLAYRE